MDLPRDVEDYIKESVDHSLGLSVSQRTLTLKLQVCEEVQRRLRDQYLLLLSKSKEKDEAVERARAEAVMNAQAVKRFVEENRRLASECSNLAKQCSKWEKECSLYDRDREALMEFGNETDERAKEAEARVHDLEEEVRMLKEEVQFHKHESNAHMRDTSKEGAVEEEQLLKSVVASLMIRDEVTENALCYLEANIGEESCQRLLKMWSSLRPSTQIVLSLAAEVLTLQKDKEHLRANLHTAEEEVKVLFEENNMLDKENKRLLGQNQKDSHHSSYSGKQMSGASAKSNKRKSSAKMSSSNGRKIEFNDFDSPRKALSPLHCNSPNSTTHEK